MNWFRAYDQMVDDPKMLKLSVELRWRKIELMCIANRQSTRGTLPDIEDIAIHMRISVQDAEGILETMIRMGHVDRNKETQVLSVHGWNERQFKSDNTTERSHKSKAKKKEQDDENSGNVPMSYRGNVYMSNGGNGLAGAIRTEQNRADTEQSRAGNVDDSGSNSLEPEDPVQVPDWMPIDQWMDFVSMRVDMGKADPDKPWSRVAAKNAIGKLTNAKTKGHDVADILRDSVINRWQGIWIPKTLPNLAFNQANRNSGDSLANLHDATGESALNMAPSDLRRLRIAQQNAGAN